jgi:hypothetical protein
MRQANFAEVLQTITAMPIPMRTFRFTTTSRYFE